MGRLWRAGSIPICLATSIFVIGVERRLDELEKLPDVEGIIIDSNGDIHSSTGIEKMLITIQN